MGEPEHECQWYWTKYITLFQVVEVSWSFDELVLGECDNRHGRLSDGSWPRNHNFDDGHHDCLYASRDNGIWYLHRYNYYQGTRTEQSVMEVNVKDYQSDGFFYYYIGTTWYRYVHGKFANVGWNVADAYSKYSGLQLSTRTIGDRDCQVGSSTYRVSVNGNGEVSYWILNNFGVAETFNGVSERFEDNDYVYTFDGQDYKFSRSSRMCQPYRSASSYTPINPGQINWSEYRSVYQAPMTSQWLIAGRNWKRMNGVWYQDGSMAPTEVSEIKLDNIYYYLFGNTWYQFSSNGFIVTNDVTRINTLQGSSSNSDYQYGSQQRYGTPVNGGVIETSGGGSSSSSSSQSTSYSGYKGWGG